MSRMFPMAETREQTHDDVRILARLAGHVTVPLPCLSQPAVSSFLGFRTCNPLVCLVCFVLSLLYAKQLVVGVVCTAAFCSLFVSSYFLSILALR
ncbi:hypothetical protein DL96DRAFT_1581175 [Flagelloscypha sp. PMI_526]|nr:hypothetical protein DL96DRAFT_1581175 [Flagelloscypha sp. PMI_526]